MSSGWKTSTCLRTVSAADQTMRILVCSHRWDTVAQDATDTCNECCHLEVNMSTEQTGNQCMSLSMTGQTFLTLWWIALLHSKWTAVLWSDQSWHQQAGCGSSRVYYWWKHWSVSSLYPWIGYVWQPWVDAAETSGMTDRGRLRWHIHDAKIWHCIRKLNDCRLQL